MAYIGNTPGVSSQRTVQSEIITGSPKSVFIVTSGYSLGYIDVFVNGVQQDESDFTAADGVTVTLAIAAAVGDVVRIVAWLPRGLSDGYLKSESDARFLNLAGGTLTGNLGVGVSPSARLHVYQDSSSTSVMSGAYIQNFSFTTNAQAGIGFWSADNFNAKVYTLRSGSSAGNLVFATNGGGGVGEANVAERARITSTGDFLINSTSTTTARLVVRGANASFNNTASFQNNAGDQSLDILAGFALTNGTSQGVAAGSVMTLRSSGAGAGVIAFATGNNEAVRITASGDVAIGTTTAASKLDINAGFVPATGVAAALTLRQTSDGGIGLNFVNGVTSNTNPLASIRALVTSSGAGTDDGILSFSTSANAVTFERARIDSSGNFLVGGTSTPGGDSSQRIDLIASSANTGTWTARILSRNTSNGTAAFLGSYRDTGAGVAGVFAHNANLDAWATLYLNTVDGTANNGGNVVIGGLILAGTTTGPTGAWNSNSRYHFRGGIQISHTGNANTWRQMSWSGDTADPALYFPGGTSLSSTANVPQLSASGAWVSASDARSKTNVQGIHHGLNSVMTSQPRTYNRVDVPGTFIGFVAQELKEVVPEVVFGSEEMSYGVDYGSLVAVAFKAIQELKAIVDAQAERIAVLEAK